MGQYQLFNYGILINRYDTDSEGIGTQPPASISASPARILIVSSLLSSISFFISE